MARTVDELLAFVRHESLRLDTDPVDVATVVEETAQEYRAVAARGGVRIETRAPRGLVVRADRDALRRGLANLVANAVRVSTAGAPILVAGGRQDGWVWFGVRDFGPGIRPDDQPLVFRRAWRDGAPVEPGAGAGLGLALVRQLAEAHDGTVRLTSVPGSGASFTIWIPTWGPRCTPSHSG